MEWIPRGLPNIHAPVPICGEFEEKNIKLQLWARVGFSVPLPYTVSFFALLSIHSTPLYIDVETGDGVLCCALLGDERRPETNLQIISIRLELPKNIHFNKYLYLFYLIKYLKFNKPEKQIFIKCKCN